SRWRSRCAKSAFAAIVIGVLQLTGCTSGGVSGSLRAVSLTNNPVQLPGNFVAVYFSHDEVAGTSFMLSSVPPDQLTKGKVDNALILHIELLWEPKAGQTPMDSSATNASIRYVLISNGEMGIYGGAGFALPEGDVTGSTLR